MFLSKRSNGNYCPGYSDESGRKCRVSKRTHSKPEAQQEEHLNRHQRCLSALADYQAFPDPSFPRQFPF